MNELLIISKLKKTIIFINKSLENFPKKEIILKQKIEILLYDLLEITYLANYKKEERISLIYEALVKIKMLDFYLNIALENKLVTYKKFINICNYLNEITKMNYGWINSEKKKH